MRTSSIFVVGSLNIDLVTRVDRLPCPGETIPGSDLAVFPGGKGANQACAAARLGGQAVMIGDTGDDIFGAQLRASLQSAGVDASGVGVCGRATGSACISVLPSGENTIVISPGANAALTPGAALSRLSALGEGDLVLLQLEIPMETVSAVLEYAANRGAITVLDPAPARELPPELLRNVGFLTPNQSEAAQLLAEPHLRIENSRTAEDVARRLLARGPAAVILKLGADGCFLAFGDYTGAIDAFPVPAVDTTAAGDTFNGGFAAALAEGMPIPDAARFASAAAALSVTRHGAQSSIPTRAEVLALLHAPERVHQEAGNACL